MDVLLISDAPQKWTSCLSLLKQRGGTFRTVPAMPEALDCIRNTPPILAILDLSMNAGEIRKAIIDMLMINASVHTAVTSEMPEELFHDTMEGLGILMALPTAPGTDDMENLLVALEKVR